MASRSGRRGYRLPLVQSTFLDIKTRRGVETVFGVTYEENLEKYLWRPLNLEFR